MLILKEIPSDNKIEIYTNAFKNVLLKELKSNGFNKGFNFDSVNITFNDGLGYNVPKYVGELELKQEEIYYVPKGVKFERFFELYFTEYQGQVEITKRDRNADLYLPPEIKFDDGVTGTPKEYVSKGFYPGQVYFQAQIDRVNQSLVKYQDSIIEQFQNFENYIPLNPIDSIADMEKNIYQYSKSIVYINSASIEFLYNIDTGEIYNLKNTLPPALI